MEKLLELEEHIFFLENGFCFSILEKLLKKLLDHFGETCKEAVR